MDQDRKG
jgi:hypothetical protein